MRDVLAKIVIFPFQVVVWIVFMVGLLVAKIVPESWSQWAVDWVTRRG